ncbi:MAG TPA: hypothetical protein VEV42_04830, partial [Pyrinomonadaceae bacterium]|nr:hypothetical protein [Pyrinomonadaceae bacterium]
MITEKSAAVLINCVLLASLLVSASAQQHTREAPANIRSKLFRQVLADFKELRECIEQDEGGVRAAEEKTTVEEVDLNRDGVPEYKVEMGGGCACGAANCSVFIYRKAGDG